MKKKSPSPKKFRIGIVGTGGMANVHATEFLKIPGVELAAVCDVDAKRAGEFAAKHGGSAAVFTDFKKLLAEASVDAISNVTPDSLHAPLSLQAIAADKHILCEKPLATNHADALSMARAAKKAGVINMVGSTIARECGQGVYIHSGPEQAVASTKAFTLAI